MNIIAFDTCFDACSVAVGRGLRTLTPAIASVFEPMKTGHAERLLPMIDEAMAEAGLSFAKLDRIVVTNGPGTFTGMRIGVATARALALVTGAPIVAVSSLALMAMSADIPGDGARGLAIAGDARRDEVYLQQFDRHTLTALSPPKVLSLESAARSLGANPIVIAGSGARALAAEASRRGVDAEAVLPDLLPQAIDVLFRGIELRPQKIIAPLYLRAPDATPPAKSPLFGAPA